MLKQNRCDEDVSTSLNLGPKIQLFRKTRIYDAFYMFSTAFYLSLRIRTRVIFASEEYKVR